MRARVDLRARMSVIACIALFLALGGGTAFAAKHYLLTSTRQIKPSVRKALRGARGTTGATGITGDTGNTGPAGPLLSVLPSGRTETGVFNAAATTSGDGVGDIASSAISFAIPLASAPTPTIVQAGTTAGCQGSVTAPTAAPGALCIYVGSQANVAQIFAESPYTALGGTASQYGAAVVLDSEAPGNFYSTGTWAVTAP